MTNETKNKTNKTIIAIISILLVCILIPLCILGFSKLRLYFTDSDTNIDNTEESNNNEEDKRSDIEKLLDYVPTIKDIYLTDLDAYSGNNYTVDTIGDGLLLSMAYENTEPIKFENTESIPEDNYWFCGDTKCRGEDYYRVEDINKTILSMYNKTEISLGLLPNSYAENVYGISITAGILSLYPPYYIDYHGRGASSYFKISKIISNETDIENNLIIYEKAGFYSFSDEYNIDTIYVYKTTKEKYDTTNVLKKIEDSEDAAKEYIENNWDLFNTFKHTFKLNSEGKYYWYSTEVE